MELFDNRGHITTAGFDALTQGTADELARLELTEHLSFCDACCARYAELLTGDVLLCPPAPVAHSVMERIRRRTRTVLFNRYVKVGLAASLAMGLWLTGLSYGLIPSVPATREEALSAPAQSGTVQQFLDTQQKNASRMKESLDALVTETNDASPTWNMKISQAIDQLFSSISHKGDHKS